MAERIEFVRVVDAEGNAMEGFADPVPSHWIGTDLLPKGAKRAPEQEDGASDDGTEELTARVTELEEENEQLRERLVAATVDQVEPPAGNASTEEWAAYAQARGASAQQVQGRSRDELRSEFGPKQA